MNLVDKLTMTRPFLSLISILLSLYSSHCLAQFIGLYSGINHIEQQYLQDSARSQEDTTGIELDMRSYRHKPVGWYTRGPQVRIQQSTHHLDTDIHIPLYQFHLHQGIWFEFEWQESTFETQLSGNQIYLDEDGTAQTIAADTSIRFERQLQRGQVYWYESVKDEGPINTVGLFYSVETSPVNVDISSTNANLFDGRFSGFGFSLGRIKDDRGLNFQWHLNLAQLDTDFSNRATQHRSLSSLESTVYQIELKLDWHYRYYIMPYWYLVPSIHYQYSRLLQTQFEPKFVEHDAFGATQLSGFIALRRYF